MENKTFLKGFIAGILMGLTGWLVKYLTKL